MAKTATSICNRRLQEAYNNNGRQPRSDCNGYKSVAHIRTKHIDIRYHFVHEQTEEGNLNIQYCNTEEMLADLFTKPLFKDSFSIFFANLQ